MNFCKNIFNSSAKETMYGRSFILIIRRNFVFIARNLKKKNLKTILKKRRTKNKLNIREIRKNYLKRQEEKLFWM